jgi:hypothetical protein
MRVFAARLRAVWLLAGLALLLVPAAQARRAADPIVGTWGNVAGGITIAVTQQGSGFVGDLKAVPGCSSFGSIGVHAWTITGVSGSTYTGTAMTNIGTNGSDCWPEGSQPATWVVSGSNLTLTTGSKTSSWTKAGAGPDLAARDAAVRTAVRNAINMVHPAYTKSIRCKWKHCTLPAKKLWKEANKRYWILSKLTAGTARVGEGLKAAITAMRYWEWVALDIVHADAAAKANNKVLFDRYYNLCLQHLKLVRKYEKRAVAILWPS